MYVCIVINKWRMLTIYLDGRCDLHDWNAENKFSIYGAFDFLSSRYYRHFCYRLISKLLLIANKLDLKPLFLYNSTGLRAGAKV